MRNLSAFSPFAPPREEPPTNGWSRDLIIALICWGLIFTLSLSAYPWTDALLAAAMAIPLVFRRHHPMLMLYGCTLAGILQLSISFMTPAVLLVPYVIYSVARWVEDKSAARLSVVIGLIGSVLGPVAWAWQQLGQQGSASLIGAYSFTCMAVVLTAYVIGRRRYEAIRATQDRVVAQETTLRMQLAASEQRARMAEVNERNRIARELHDIVAHSLSVIVVQAEGGRALAAKKPELAADVLDTIAETSRDALTEMRRIVGVLRNGPEQGPADWKPAPGLGDLAELVQRTSERAEFEVRGALPPVPPTLGLTVYRIVQEALTNVLKHAGSEARSRVLVDATDPRRLLVTISDDGRGAQTRSDGLGNGLRGMGERAQLVNGQVSAGPRQGGGFEVRAMFPLPGQPAAAPPRPAVHQRRSFGELAPSPGWHDADQTVPLPTAERTWMVPQPSQNPHGSQRPAPSPIRQSPPGPRPADHHRRGEQS